MHNALTEVENSEDTNLCKWGSETRSNNNEQKNVTPLADQIPLQNIDCGEEYLNTKVQLESINEQ